MQLMFTSVFQSPPQYIKDLRSQAYTRYVSLLLRESTPKILLLPGIPGNSNLRSLCRIISLHVTSAHQILILKFCSFKSLPQPEYKCHILRNWRPLLQSWCCCWPIIDLNVVPSCCWQSSPLCFGSLLDVLFTYLNWHRAAPTLAKMPSIVS